MYQPIDGNVTLTKNAKYNPLGNFCENTFSKLKMDFYYKKGDSDLWDSEGHQMLVDCAKQYFRFDLKKMFVKWLGQVREKVAETIRAGNMAMQMDIVGEETESGSMSSDED